MTPLQPETTLADLRDALPADSPLDVPPRRRGWPWTTLLAWLVIAGAAGFIIARSAQRGREKDPAPELVTMQLQARYFVGAASLNLPGAGGKVLYPQVQEALDRGSYSQRLRFAVLAGELVGPAEALKSLKELENDRRSGSVEARDASVEAVRKLERLYVGYEKVPGKPNLSAADQDWLRSRMGWFGELALAPGNGNGDARAVVMAPARRTVLVCFTMIGFMLVGLSIGGFLLLLFVLTALLGRLSGGLKLRGGHGGVYAETFALYMVLYIGLSYAARWAHVPPHLRMGFGGLIMFLSLAALVWPRLRGIPWRQTADDLGLNLGREPLAQLLCGPATYLSALPLLAGGLVIMFMLMFAQKHLGLGDPTKPGEGPSHPIIGVALQGNPWLWLQVFVVACIAAPVVEEIMFRGVLYRHLREASQRWGRVLSILASVVVSSFVFAAIHPQGWLGVPVLMALATAFALAREWRQSLLPSMIAHGINNSVSLLVLLLAAA